MGDTVRGHGEQGRGRKLRTATEKRPAGDENPATHGVSVASNSAAHDAAPGSATRSDQAKVRCILLQTTEVNGTESHAPNAIVDLFETYRLTRKDEGNVDVSVPPFDAAATVDAPHIEVVRIRHLVKAERHATGRRLVDRRRWLLAEGFVGTFVVEDVPEAVEGDLLGAERLSSRVRRLGLER